MSARGDIEDAVITAIEALKQDQVDGYLTAVVPYNGDTSPDEEDPAFMRLVQKGTPVVGVTTGPSAYDDVTLHHKFAKQDTTIEVLVVSGNPRSHEAHLRGDNIDGDPGLYAIEEDIRDAVWGAVLGVSNVGIPDPLNTAAVLQGERFTAWLLTYKIPIHVEAPEWDPDAGYYETIRTDINNADDDTADPVVRGDITL